MREIQGYRQTALMRRNRRNKDRGTHLVRHKRLAALCLQIPAVTWELFLAFLCLSSQVTRGRLAMFSFRRWETEARKSPCLRYRGAHKGSPVGGWSAASSCTLGTPQAENYNRLLLSW